VKYSKYHIKDDRIVFDYYEFYFSSLRKDKVLTVGRINEVDFNTYPYSMEIDKGEIIFFNHNDERIKPFAERNKIIQSDKVDVWQLLCNEFLDTEFESDNLRAHQHSLHSLQFTEAEVKAIQKRIKWALFGTMEWNYLGHWDLLAMKQHRSLFYRLRGADFYWWTMGIALRGKNKVR